MCCCDNDVAKVVNIWLRSKCFFQPYFSQNRSIWQIKYLNMMALLVQCFAKFVFDIYFGYFG